MTTIKRTVLSCLTYKIATAFVLVIAASAYFYSLACVDTTNLTLSSVVRVVIRRHTDKPGGEYISRSVDIFANGKRIRRMWCSPMPSTTGVTGIFVALCKGETAEYLAVRDQDAFWILNLADPREVHAAFPEKNLPEIEAEYNVTDPGDVLPMPKKISNWTEHLNRKRSLLAE